jgi:predicted MFS family arabinose efflux permease
MGGDDGPGPDLTVAFARQGYPAPPRSDSVANPAFQVRLAAVLFALAGTGAVILVAVSGLAGLALSGRGELATLPLSLGMLGGVAATVPAAQAMARWGRRRGFQIFHAIALSGAAVCAWALRDGSFVLFCAGSALVGTIGPVSGLYRFAAAEAAPPEARGRAIGTVLLGGVVAGLLGAPVAAWASDFLDARFAGSYLAVGLLLGLVLLMLPWLDVPRPPPGGPRKPLREILRDRAFLTPLVAGAVAFGAMVLTMVAAPLSLHSGGHGLSATAYVLQAHVVAMYLPSFFTGRLIERVGPGKGMAAGLLTLAGCVGVNLLGNSVPHHWIALVLLGVGWNLLFVAATTLLSRSYSGSERAAVQGTNDLLLALSAAGASFAAGPLHDSLGWSGLNLVVLGALAVASLALLALGRPRSIPAAPANPA